MREETEVVIAAGIGAVAFALLYFAFVYEPPPQELPKRVKTFEELVGPDLSKKPEGMETFDYMTGKSPEPGEKP